MAAMNIQGFYEPESGTWTYLLSDPAENVAAIIDPVWVYDIVSGQASTTHTDEILAVAAGQGLDVQWVLETHAHADHLSSAAYIREQTGARVAIGRGIRSVQANFIKVFNLDDVLADGSQFDRLLAEGDVIELGGLDIHVMETPGHTSDSLTYLAEDAAFIGDTLFTPAFGTARCDFPGGDAAMLFDSIARLHALPPDTRLHLCHDYPGAGVAPTSVVTVAESRAGNIHAKEGTSRADYIAMRRARDAQLQLPKLIYPSLQVNIRAGRAPAAEGNGARYLRVPFNADLTKLLREDQPGMRDDMSNVPDPVTAGHWDAAYQEKTFDLHSWYQSEPRQSLAMIGAAAVQPTDPIIDVGGGASLLVDRLLSQGYRDLTVLDISRAALETSRQRLGEKAAAVDWICADIRTWQPPRAFAVWHDRALFHFLTKPEERQSYVRALRAGLQVGGAAVIAAFAVGGPQRCSGLDIVQYDAERLAAELGPGFELENEVVEDHMTPMGGRQLFSWFLLKRVNDTQ